MTLLAIVHCSTLKLHMKLETDFKWEFHYVFHKWDFHFREIEMPYDIVTT